MWWFCSLEKKQHKYVCVIEAILPNDEAEVIGMKQVGNSGFVLNESDISIIKLDQITEILESPTLHSAGNRIKYEFKKHIETDS